MSRASVRRAVAPALRPCSGWPSRHSVASLPLSQASSTTAPAHASGIVAAIRNQYVAHCGPNASPSSASRYVSACAACHPMRSVRSLTSSRSTGTASGWASVSSRGDICASRRRTCSW